MKTNYTFGRVGIMTALLAALTGCTTYVVQRPEPQTTYIPPAPQPTPVYVQQAPPPPPAPAVVVIQREDDFVQPLSPYGDWVVVGSYGRCWRPARVEADWRPYANGHWELTDGGWYWVSDEPWAWATYHYGRWQLAAGYGWVWVPQTEWAPAWVSWREGGGYVGWAPLPPEPRGGVSVNVTIAPAAFCFVEERRMHDPVRPTTVIVNNTTIINKTVNITKTKVVNKVVINEGPRVDQVERASGRKIQQTSISELRHQEEEPVAEKHQNLRARENRGQQEQSQPEPRKETGPQALPNRDRGNEKPAPVTPPPANVQPPRTPVAPQREISPREKQLQQEQERQKQQQQKLQQQQQEKEQQQQEKLRQQQEKDRVKLQQQQQQEQRQQQRQQPREPQQPKPQPEVQPAPRTQPERVLPSGKQQNQTALRNGRAAEPNPRDRQPGGTNTTENPGQIVPK